MDRLRDSSGGHINGLYDREAAAEIERLHAELRHAREGLTKGRTRMKEDNDRLRLENTKLRESVHSCHAGCTRAGCVNERLRAALRVAVPALELGCDALRNEAERYHAEMAGYRPHRHKQVDQDYETANAAWQAARAELGE